MGRNAPCCHPNYRKKAVTRKLCKGSSPRLSPNAREVENGTLYLLTPTAGSLIKRSSRIFFRHNGRFIIHHLMKDFKSFLKINYISFEGGVAFGEIYSHSGGYVIFPTVAA